jgi:hypothetical protein
MQFPGIPGVRLLNQKIEGSDLKSPKELIEWLGAMQAQDFAMAKWAIGLRLNHPTDAQIVSAFNNGEIIRTHLMRPTWHFVSAEDVYWMLDLTGPQIKSSMKSRDKQLGLDEQVLRKSNKILERMLSGGKNLTSDELAGEYKKNRISTGENRMWHLFLRAELDGLICSGGIKNGRQTFGLLAERVPNKRTLSREESLVKLATRYFSSHGPATIRDFVWWSGLRVRDARNAVESSKPGLVAETIGSDTFWLPGSSPLILNPGTTVHLLPAYDEYLIGYTDRNAALPQARNKKTISSNGIFRPVVVINGQVAGLWRRTTVKEMIVVEVQLFRKQPAIIKKLIIEQAEKYGRFSGREITISIKKIP